MPKGKKYGGRKAGTPNRTTAQMRQLLSEFTQKKWPEVQRAFSKLSAKEKVIAYTRLLKFTMPEYSNINFSLNQFSENDLEMLLNHLKENEQTEPNQGD